MLNGASSSGKTQTGAALREILECPYLLMDIDDFLAMFPGRYHGMGDRCAEGIAQTPCGGGSQLQLGPFGQKFLSGFHHAIKAMVEQDNSVIVSHLILHRNWLLDCARLWRSYSTLFVGIWCRPEVAEQRERSRGNRKIGFSQAHRDVVHLHGNYDLIVDTSDQTPEICAKAIENRLVQGPPPQAFRQLLPSRRPVQSSFSKVEV